MNNHSSKYPMYYVVPTRLTPMIKFIPKLSILELKGRSSPENPMEFYEPLNRILNNINRFRISQLTINLEMEYFNTSSLKCIFNLLKKISTFPKGNIEIQINWFYETGDEDILEAGEDISTLINYKFNYIEITDHITYNKRSA